MQDYYVYNADQLETAGLGLPEWKESMGFGKYLQQVINDGLEINLHAQMPYYHADLSDTHRWPLFLDNYGSNTDAWWLGDNVEGKIVNTDLAEIIGTAKIKMIIKDGSDIVTDISGPIEGNTPVHTYRIYLYDINMNSGKSMSEVCMMTYTDMESISRTGYNELRDGYTTSNSNYLSPTDTDANTWVGVPGEGNIGFIPVGDNRHKILFVGGKIGGWLDDLVNDRDCQLATEPIAPEGLKGNNNYVIPIPEGPAVKDVTEIQFRKMITKSFTITGGTDVITLGIADQPEATTFIGEGADDGQGGEVLTNDSKIHYSIISTKGGFSVPLEHITMVLKSNKTSLEISGIGMSPNTYGETSPIWKQYLLGDDTYTVFATVQIKDADNASTPATKIRTKTLSNKNYTQILGSSNRVVIDDEGQSYFQLPDVDIWKINGVTGGTAGNVGGTVLDLKSDFIFDDGQRDATYDYGRLYIRPDKVAKYTNSSVTLDISYDYFQHSGTGLPFTVNSYEGFEYKNIPLYTIEDRGETVSLANVLDFRSTRASRENGTELETDKPIISGGFPKTGIAAGDVINERHRYYLPRVDKVILKKDTNTDDHSFEILKGIPSLDPQAPSDREDAMSLYILSVPPYTHNASDVRIQYIDNQRYRMSDIGKLSQRISNLEHFSTLSNLESQIEGKNILSYDGNSIAFKKGILVDSFRGSGVGDVSDPDYACSVDIEKGQLRPSFQIQNIDLAKDVIASTGIAESTDGIITLSHSDPISFLNQTASSGKLKVNPFNLVNWLGSATIDPPGDNWFDVNYRPVIKINTNGENDNWKIGNLDDHSVGSVDTNDLQYLNAKGFGTQWNDWESVWSGIEVTSSDLYDEEGRQFIDQARIAERDESVSSLKENNTLTVSRSASLTSQSKTRLGIRVRSLPHRLLKIVNGKTVDVTIVPFIRSKTLTINAYGLKPNTVVYPFFDGIDVSAHCQPKDMTVGGTITTDVNGSVLELSFIVPAGKFTSGEKIFRLTDSSTNVVTNTETASDAIYHAKGVSDLRNSGIVSTRPPIVRRQTVTSENIPTDVFNRTNSLNSQTNTLWVDPLAQTFYVEPNANPSGLFLHSVDLYFSKKDSTLPVTLQIRPTTNGYPHPSVIAPFSEVVLMPDSVNVDSESSSVATTFTFSSPVYLESGEYAIVISANSDDYELYSATIGEDDTGTLNRITSSPHTGSLFHAQNESIAEPDYTTDLMFSIKRYNFSSTQGEAIFKNSTSGPIASRKADCDTFKINAVEFIPATSSMTHTAQFAPSLDFAVNLNENITKGSSVTNKSINKEDSNFKVVSKLNYSLSTVSPVIDTKMLNVTCIENSVNELQQERVDDEKSPRASGHPISSRARYITRRVTLSDGMAASDLKVFLSVYKPSGAEIKVFVKYSDGETDINTSSYLEMEVKDNSDNFTSLNAYDFKDIEFSLKQEDYDVIGGGNLKKFVIKVCMFGKDDEVPIVKDLRAVALD